MPSKDLEPPSLQKSKKGGRSRRLNKKNEKSYNDYLGGKPFSPQELQFMEQYKNTDKILPSPLVNGNPPWSLIKEMLGEHTLGKSGLLELRLTPEIGYQLLDIAGQDANVWEGFLHVSLGKVLIKKSKDLVKINIAIKNLTKKMITMKSQPSPGFVRGDIGMSKNKRMIIAKVYGFNSKPYKNMILKLKKQGVSIVGTIKSPHITLVKVSDSETHITEKAFPNIEQNMKTIKQPIPLMYHSICVTAPSKSNAVIDESVIGQPKATRWRLVGNLLPQIVSKENNNPRPVCKYFNTKGGCLRGKNCFYLHEKITKKSRKRFNKEKQTI